MMCAYITLLIQSPVTGHTQTHIHAKIHQPYAWCACKVIHQCLHVFKPTHLAHNTIECIFIFFIAFILSGFFWAPAYVSSRQAQPHGHQTVSHIFSLAPGFNTKGNEEKYFRIRQTHSSGCHSRHTILTSRLLLFHAPHQPRMHGVCRCPMCLSFFLCHTFYDHFVQ